MVVKKGQWWVTLDSKGKEVSRSLARPTEKPKAKPKKKAKKEE